MIRFTDRADFLSALCRLPDPDEGARALACARQAVLTKPAGSLGRLEDIAVFMAGWQAVAHPRADRVRAALFAGNHGVAARGVSAFPADVTAQMVANFANGGAAINALARMSGAELVVVPLDLDQATGDIAREPAMTEGECLAALNAGAAVVTTGTDLLFTGEMGIANTTPAAALCAVSCGGSADEWAGMGSGIDQAALARKRIAITLALQTHALACTDPFETLRRLGGREIAAMAGAILAARLRRVPVLLDGFICCAAIAPIAAQYPAITDHCLAAHCSAEAGHARLLDWLGLDPLLNLGLRLGEGSGAAIAAQIVQSAIATHNDMATFAEANVAAAR